MASGGGALLERDACLERAFASLEHARGGNGELLAIVGEAGIGKTSLLHALCEQAERSDVTVLRSRGAELERQISFGIAQQLFGAVVRGSTESDRARLLDGPAAPAGPLLSFAAEETGSSLPVVQALYVFTANLAERGPLLLAVDDAHWADSDSLRWLAYLERRLEGLPVLNDTMNGGPDNDNFDGRQGDDTSRGDAGDDTFWADAGHDKFSGGEGRDTANYQNAGSGIFVKMGSSEPCIPRVGDASQQWCQKDGMDGWDIVGADVENLKGSEFPDRIIGHSGTNLELWGFGGDDTMSGGSGTARIYGGRGNDWLYPNLYCYDTRDAGTDFLHGDEGDDRLFAWTEITDADVAETHGDYLDGGPHVNFDQAFGDSSDYYNQIEGPHSHYRFCTVR